MDRAGALAVTLGWPARLALALVIVALVGLAWDGVPLRWPVVVTALVLAPGLAIASLANLRDPLVLGLVTIPVGASVNGLIALILVYVGLLSTELVLTLVVAITLVSALVGDMERSARALLLGLAALPGIVLLAAELARTTS